MTDHDLVCDAWESVAEAFRIIRERAANGGKWWEPKMRCICGIDPGIVGGIAFVRGEHCLAVFDIPVVDGEIDVPAVVDLLKLFNPSAAYIERAGAMPKQGVSSTFKYGQAYGALRACCAAMGIPQILVAATKWKKHYGLDSDKEKSRSMAIRLWPVSDRFRRKKDHGRAEAALIARYGGTML